MRHSQIYVDGNPEWIAYFNTTSNEKAILPSKIPPESVLSLHSQSATLAEFQAIYEALSSVPNDSKVEILSDSQSAVKLLSRGVRLWGTKPKIHKKPIRHKAQSIRRLIKRKKLRVKYVWVPREHNLAGRLLENKK